MSMLSIAGLRAGYGKIEVLHDVALTVAQGQIVTLIGANGAGKTTLLKTISGLIRPNAGSIDFEGESIARRPAHKIVERGISHVPEGRAILKRMTVLDNLRMGAFVRREGRASATSSPSKVIWPRSAASTPVTRLKNVVLPAPFGPISAWMWPRATSMRRSFSA